ncbi:MAG: DUF2333 family protein [Deltaproteobacteria bacterium]|nr:DUF2333 family protein [Deltaproteobacteria bacterium]
MEKNAKGFEFRKFATPRIIGGIAIAIIILWALSIIFGSPQGPPSKNTAARQHDTAVATSPSGSDGHSKTMLAEYPSKAPGAAKGLTTATADTTDQGPPATQETASPASSAKAAGSASAQQPTTHQQPAATTDQSEQTGGHGDGQTAAEPGTTAGHPLAATAVVAPVHKPTPKGVAFVEAVIKPLRYELEERWWGWRPNDIIDVTDNVNNFQMGVLEVTRRAAVALAERISRTGTTDAFDKNLEQAMNWFMVKASSYWFPSAESKYREGLEEMEAYLVKLRAGNATFYTRTDNLIPLLASFEDLLGSCDENLVKQVNSDGTPMSFFSADDHFFYTQGVASSMATVLEAVHHDFLLTLESRHATELLHHAILSCQRAAKIDPWIILDRDLSSVFANHRANMAAPVSHARFYLGQLIKTLST